MDETPVADLPTPTTEEPKPKSKKNGPKKAVEAKAKKAPVKAKAEPKLNGKATKPVKVASAPEPEPVKMPARKSIPAEIRRAAILLKHVSDGTRLRVMLLLKDGPLCVGDICREMAQSQPAVSHHLALMRHGGVIEPERKGKNNYYSLTPKGATLIAAIASVVVVGE